MNRKVSLGVTISLVAVAIAITCIITMTFSQNLFNSMISSGASRTELSEVESYVQSNYLYQIDEEVAQEYISKAYLMSLGDKYATYYTAEEYAEQLQLETGYTVGLEMEYTLDESGYILVTAVEDESPAALTGFVAGDIIVAINGNDVLSNGYDASVALLGGSEGETVKITVRREGVDTEYQLTKRRVEVETVSYRMLDGYIGYIKISSFNATTANQFEEAVDTLISGGADQIIFDVRNNKGGTLDSVEDVLNYVLPAGSWVTATFKDGKSQVIVKTDDTYSLGVPAAVLVNENTSAEAEMFAAAMRDSGKATLVGTTTDGKGVIQYVQQLSTGAAIQITVATYETMKTPCFDELGLKPNFEVTLTKEEQDNFRYLDETTDPQLRKAIDVVDTGV